MYKIKDIVNTILCGDVLTELKKIPDESIDMVVTSPPYYGLRKYGTSPSVWGGCPDCEHEWIMKTKKGISGGTKSKKVKTHGTENFQIVPVTQFGFCSKCNAWLGEFGSEPSFQLYLEHSFTICEEIRRVLKPSGSLWWNLDDSRSGSMQGAGADRSNTKQGTNRGTAYMADKSFKSLLSDTGIAKKSLMGIPDRFKIGMIDRGWICRNDVIWQKPNQMPESTKDRFTDDFERFFWFTKNGKYYFEQQKEPYQSKVDHSPRDKASEKYKGTGLYSAGGRDYYSQGGRNKRTVWAINTKGYKGAHFATYPEELVITPIIACCPPDGIVLDPFIGSGTSGVVARKNGKNFIGIELKPDHVRQAVERLGKN